MSNTKITENKKQDKKALMVFFPLILLGAIVGAVLGFGSAWIAEETENLGQILGKILGMSAPIASPVINTVLLVIFTVILYRCRSRYAAWDGENEEEMESIEHWLSVGIVGTSVDMILSYFLFGAAINIVGQGAMGKEDVIFHLLVATAGLIYSMIVVVIFQSKMINLEKEMNPEKQGSVYDMKFQKIWLESCDEAEQQMIYKSAYKAYQTTVTACLVLWLVCIFGIMCWEFNIFPLLMVSILWMVITVSYSLESMRLSKRSGK